MSVGLQGIGIPDGRHADAALRIVLQGMGILPGEIFLIFGLQLRHDEGSHGDCPG